jgi:hypothetical protein
MANNETKNRMKKILLVALSLLMFSAAYAQFSTQPVCREGVRAKGVNTLPNWTPISTTHTLIDINGDTISLTDTLAAGKALVIDYSATWCSWCWVMHTNGILEAIKNQLGSQVSVLWVEADASTSADGIYGNGGNTQGDWTAGVNYPIVDDATANDIINTTITGFPTVVFISPSGYWCDVYGTDWGFGPYDANEAVSAISALLTSSPAANQAPIVEIGGFTSAIVNNPATFTANIVSVDPVTDITWSATNGTPATGSDNNFSTTWSATGTETVTLTVTNTTGTTTATLNVNVMEWNWGNEMSYSQNNEFTGNVGTGAGMTWGVKFPASFMANRNYLENVKYYSANAGHITLSVYQTNPDNFPAASDLLYQYTYAVSAVEDYVTFPIFDRVQLNTAKDLWIVMESNDIGYPATGVDFCGDPNGSYAYFNGTWELIYNLAAGLNYTWMIKATTSETAPAMNVIVNGPTSGITGQPLTYTVTGPSAASYAWTFDGGTPATATGTSVNVSFATAGSHNITVTATLDGETGSASTNVNIIECSLQTLPFRCGFESNENTECWTFFDADGDGYGWDLDYWNGSNYHHNGTGVAGSASFINQVGVLTPDNWMITPQIQVPAEGATLNWYVGGVDASYFSEHYTVLVSTTGTNTTDFTNMVFDGNVANVNFTLKSLDISAFAGQNIYIAFRHCNSTDVYWMLVDDIEVIAGQHAGISNVTDATVQLYPNPTSNVLNINAEGVQEVSVIDINGRTVMTEKNVNTVNLSDLANGVYYVRVITNNGVATEKIVKK